ncbi:MAG: lipoyl synthase [Desulfovibrionaceae bacterium]
MSSHEPSKPLRIPQWLRIKLPRNKNFSCTGDLLRDMGLNTVCQSAKCPNIYECFSRRVATFLILGNVCTRNCAFCNIEPGHDFAAPDPTEPDRVARAAQTLGLAHVVITSVTRDDLPDGGAAHFAATMRAVKAAMPACTTEVLIPDFKGDPAALHTVLDAAPDIVNHNVETVPSLYPAIRPQADYAQSLELLARVKQAGHTAKSGLMVGLGESDNQIYDVIIALARIGCDIVTVGQYMQPTRHHPLVQRYVYPTTFYEYEACGRAHGIPHMHCAPLVRSSYNAAKFVKGEERENG